MLNTETKSKFLCLLYTNKEKKFTGKELFKEKRGGEGWTKKGKEGFLTGLTTVIKKDPTMSIRNHTNELKVHKKTVRTEIKEDLCPGLFNGEIDSFVKW